MIRASSNQRINESAIWLRRNLGLLLILAAAVSSIVTYGAITGTAASLLKPRHVLTLLVVDVALLAALIGIIGQRILRLWASLRAGSTGSRLQKRIVVM